MQVFTDLLNGKSFTVACEVYARVVRLSTRASIGRLGPMASDSKTSRSSQIPASWTGETEEVSRPSPSARSSGGGARNIGRPMTETRRQRRHVQCFAPTPWKVRSGCGKRYDEMLWLLGGVAVGRKGGVRAPATRTVHLSRAICRVFRPREFPSSSHPWDAGR